jgi:hypothetical protein
MTRADLPPELRSLSSEQLMRLAYIKQMYSKNKAQGQSQGAGGSTGAGSGAPEAGAAVSHPVSVAEGHGEASSYHRQQQQPKQQSVLLLHQQQQQFVQPQQATWAARPPPEDAKRVRLTLGAAVTTTSGRCKQFWSRS